MASPQLQATTEEEVEETYAIMCWHFTGTDIHICVDNICFGNKILFLNLSVKR